MIDHIAFNVRDLERSRRFYEKALAPIGYALGPTFPGWVGFTRDGKTAFWLARRDPVGGSVHLAFVADSHKTVDAFHAAAIAAGGTDHGPPGLRLDYHPDYYGAFVLDPDGNNIEAVCQKPK
jgi:catechol 2,3-dioxygenase-like lactoylglutathione lyase family enzyme